MSELESQIEKLRSLCVKRDQIQEEIEAAAGTIENIAHAINNAGHQYTRSGYFPWFKDFDGEHLVFEGDNSWDGVETYLFTPEQLIAGPDPVAAEYEARQKQMAQRELENAERRVQRLRAQIEDEAK